MPTFDKNIFTKTIKVPKAKVKKLQTFLNSRGEGSDNTIETFSAHFVKQGYGVDIKVCDGNTPYIDPVLFKVVPADSKDRKVGIRYNWHEIGPIDVSDTLLGEYQFDDGDITFIVNVVQAESTKVNKKNVRRWLK